MKFDINQIEKYKVRVVHFKNLTFQLDTVDTALGIAGIENVCHKKEISTAGYLKLDFVWQVPFEAIKHRDNI